MTDLRDQPRERRFCGAFQPVHEAYAMPYRCTEPHNHVGPHKAVLDGETIATWGRFA